MPKPPEQKIQDIAPGPKPPDSIQERPKPRTIGDNWVYLIGAVVVMVSAVIAYRHLFSQEKNVGECVPQIIEKIVEKPVKAECPVVEAVKNCPVQTCKPEVIYVPQAKPDCTKEIGAACKDCRESLDFFLKKAKEPSFKLDGDDGGPVDEYDEEF
jgi:hypothetical protein